MMDWCRTGRRGQVGEERRQSHVPAHEEGGVATVLLALRHHSRTDDVVEIHSLLLVFG